MEAHLVFGPIGISPWPGGVGGSQPVVNAGSFSLSSTYSHTGRTGAASPPAGWASSGYNGSNGATSILFGGTFIGSGGSGAISDGGIRHGGSGGTGGGGVGSGGNFNDNLADYFAGHGLANSGSGGGAGARNGEIYAYTIDGRTDRFRNGGTGGSGTISISYAAPSLAVTTAANGARVGADILVQPVIQLKNSASGNLASSGIVVTAAVTSGVGVLSGATATTNSSGVASFTNLRFTSGTLGTLTLTYSAPGYANATQTIKLQTFSTAITISGSSSSNGNFVQGVWLADSAGASNILNTDLQTALTSSNLQLDSTGAITVSAAVSNATTGRSLTMNCGGSGEFTNSGGAISVAGDLTVTCANVITYANLTAVGSIRLTGTSTSYVLIYSNLTTTGGSGSEIRLKTAGRFLLDTSDKLVTAGGDVVVWTGYDKVAGTNKSSTTIYLNTSSSIETNGGKIWLAGGLDDGGADASITTSRGKWSSVVAGDGLPDGYAVGMSVNNAWDVGVFIEGGTLLNSKGGDIFIAGAQSTSSLSGYAHIALKNGARVDSGTGRIAMWGRALAGTSNWSQGIILNWEDNTTPVVVSSNATTSDAITIYSDSQAGAACSRGITGWWHGVWSASRGYQGSQILATGLGGGITLTGLGSTSTSCSGGDGWGVNIEFADVLAKSGPITVNAIGNSNGTTPGLATGWRGNYASLFRIGAWAASGGGEVGGSSITTPGGVTADLSSSSSNVVINTNSVYSWEAGYGTVINTSGSVTIQPATVTSGVVSSATDFTRAQTAGNWRFGRFSTPTRLASFTLGRSGTTSDLTYMGTSTTASSPIQTVGNVAIDGGTLLLSSNINSTSGNVTITSTGSSKSFSKTTHTISAGGDVGISSSGSVDVGSGAISAAAIRVTPTTTYAGTAALGASSGVVSISGGSTVAVSGPVTATGNITLSGSGAITNPTSGATSGTLTSSGGSASITSSGANINLTNAVSAPSGVTLSAKTTVASAAVTASSGAITVSSTDSTVTVNGTTSAQSINITPKTTYSGAGSLTATSGTLTISGGSSITPTGNFEATGNISLSGSGKLLLTSRTVNSTGGNISFTAGPVADEAIELNGSTVSTTTGSITMNGTGISGNSVNLEGVYIHNTSTVSSTSGAINLTGTSASTGFGVWFGAANIVSSSGAITINGGTLGIKTGDGATTNIGATANTTSSSNITVRGDRYSSGTTIYKSTGDVVIEPVANLFSENTTLTNQTFTGNASLTIGKPTNTRTMTVTGGAINVTGNYTLYGSAITQTTPVTTSAGSIFIYPSTTYVGAGALTSTLGAVTISGGSSISPTAAISATGNITISGSGAITNSTAAINSSAGAISITSSSGAITTSATLTASTNVSLSSGGNMTVGSTATAGNQVSVEALGTATTELNANITAGSGGILVKSAGRITSNDGASAASPRLFGTIGGPITFWTTTSSGGVSLGDFNQLSTTQSSAAGADITIGGGAADANNASLPSGNAASNANDGLIIGSTSAENVVRILSGTGNISLKAESSHVSTTSSGIEMVAGVKITGATVDMYGKAAGASGLNNTAAGVFNYFDSGTARTEIQATKNFSDHTQAVKIEGYVTTGTYGVMLGNTGSSTTLSQQTRVVTNGDNSDIVIAGDSASDGYNVFLAGVLLSTKNGDSLVDGKGGEVVLSRNATTRAFEYERVSGGTGGELKIISSKISTQSSGALKIASDGKLSLVPPAGQNFSAGLTFPLTGSTINVGGLVVGSAENTRDITLGSAVTSSGDLELYGGAQSADFAITTTGSANIEFYPTTSFSKSTNLLTASGSIQIGASSSPASSATLSTGTLTAGSDFKAYLSGALAATAAVTANGNIELFATSISNSAALTATTGSIYLEADTMALSATVSAASGVVTIAPRTDAIQINLGTETAGRLSLVAAELNRLVADVVRIGAVDGTNSGAINITAALTPTGTDTMALRTSGSVVGTSGSIAIANLAIDAAEINLPGNNGVTGGLALSASGATLTYNQTSGTFTPSTVDLIDPVYGVPSKVVLSQVPTNQPVDTFMALAFNPPPIVTLQDRYSNALTSSNASSDDYTVTATKASGPATLGGTTSVTTSTSGQATFNDLTISDIGNHTVTFTAAVTPSTDAVITGSPSATTGTYNVVVSTQTITFDGNNSTSGSMSSQTVTKNVATNLTTNAFSRTGYSFAGWNTLADGTGTSFTNGQSVTRTSDLALFAQWTANTLNVTFESNSGSSVTATTTTTATTLAAPTSPTRAGYTFDGWFPNIGLTGSKATFPYTHAQTSDFTLYAKWIANTLTVTYNSNGGSVVTDGSTTTATTLSSAPTNPTRTGWTFAGWYAAEDLTGTQVSFPYTHDQTANFTLYAKWDGISELQTATDLTFAVTGRALTTQPSIQLRFGDANLSQSGVTITAAISSGATLSGTQTAVTNASGVATFSNLGIATGTLATSYTLTFTATGYSSVTDAVSIRTLPTTVTVSTSADANGSFVDGLWMANSAAASTINTTTLQTSLASRSTTIESTGNITVSNAVTGQGGANSHLTFTTTGGNATFNANLTNSGDLVLKASGNVAIGNSVSLTTAGGSITLWSDSDSNSSGRITTGTSVSLTSSGGAITLAGGADNGGSNVTSGRQSGDGLPDGYAYGLTAGTIGIDIGDLNTLSSGAGNIFIAGHGQNLSTGSVAAGLYVGAGTSISATTGKIHIYGRSNGNSTSAEYSEAIRLKGVAANGVNYLSITNSSTASDAILLVGDASSTKGARASGISVLSWYNRASGGPKNLIANTSSGGVTLTGRGGQLAGFTSDQTGSGLELNSTAVLAKSGTITLNGDSATSDNGTAYGFSSNHVNVAQFVGASFYGAHAITINSVDMSTSSADITWNVDSFHVPNNGTSSTTVKTSGRVVIQPASNASSLTSFDRAVTTSGLSLDTGITGLTIGRSGNTQALTIPTTNSIAGDIKLYGAAVSVSGNQTATAGGDIEIYGSSISNSGTVTSNSGDVLLKADSMALSANVTASSGAVTISPATNSLQIDLGTETAGRLSLVDAELDRLVASVVRIGEVDGANSGTINVTAALTPGGTTSLALRTSGSVTGTLAGSITETHLAIHAAAVNLPGNNSITGNLAVNSTGGTVTYTQ